MLPSRSIKSLYPLALAEGEGVGTAYEYFAKRLVLGRWLATLPAPRRMLIAGLPEKYGSSLDFFLLAADLRVSALVVIDDRPAALDKCRNSLFAASAIGQLARLQPRFVLVRDLARPDELDQETFDLSVSSEVLQRLSGADRSAYVSRLASLAHALALFAPNRDNVSHSTISGLSGLSLEEISTLAGPSLTSGYVDMPPFPPGLTRSAEQREHASSGRFEAFAMRGLGTYARAEHLFPSGWRRRHAHIAYSFSYRVSQRLSQAV